MQRLFRAASVLALSLTATPGATEVATASSVGSSAASRPSPGQWTVAQVYKGDDPYSSRPFAVAALGPDDEGAGGDLEDSHGTTHGNGSSWTRYAMP